MNLFFIISTLLFFSLNSFSQYNFGIKLNGGLSRISESGLEFREIKSVPSGQAGLYNYLLFGKRSMIGIEILFIQIEGKQKFELNYFDSSGNNTFHVIDYFYQHVSYLCVPVYYGLSFNNFYANIGSQVAWVLASSGREKGKGSDNGIPFEWDNKFDRLNIKNYDYGARLGLSYRLSPKISIESNYYHGINNLLDNKSRKWKVRQLTVGVKYNLRASGTKTENKSNDN